MAVAKTQHPLFNRYRKTIVLGALRENVVCVPGVHWVFPHLSLSHFYKPGLPGGWVPFLWPGPRMKSNLYFRKAVAAYQKHETAVAFLQLGRLLHLVADMACPVHAHRVVHETKDPYEWWVEAHVNELRALSVPDFSALTHPAEAVERMARMTTTFRPDGTKTAWGRLLRRVGLRHPVGAQEAGEQARTLIPVAAGYSAAVFALFIDTVGIGRGR